MAVLWLTVFRFFSLHLFDRSLQRLLQLGAEACCSQSQPAGIWKDLWAPASATGSNAMGWFSSAHWQAQALGSLHRISPCHYAHGCSHCCMVQTSCSQAWPEWSAFSSTSGFLAGHDMKHHSSNPQISQIYLIYKLREGLTLLHATERQNTSPTLIDNSTPSLTSTVLFVVVFFPHISFNYCVVIHGKWKLLYAESSILLSVKLMQPGWLLK